MENPILLFILGQMITGAAIWGAIRADIKNIHARISEIRQTSNEAHQRIDRLLERRATERQS